MESDIERCLNINGATLRNCEGVKGEVPMIKRGAEHSTGRDGMEREATPETLSKIKSLQGKG